MNHRLLISVGLSVVSLLQAACSDTPTSAPSVPSTVPGDTPGSADPQQAALDYAECMRENGLESYPDPQFANSAVIVGGDGIDPNDPDFVAADEQCAALLEAASGGFDGTNDAELQQFQEGILRFAACMREHGIDFPDPRFGDDGQVQMGAGGDPGAPAIVAAREACASLLPRPGAGS
jgi:hypothetical protein